MLLWLKQSLLPIISMWGYSTTLAQEQRFLLRLFLFLLNPSNFSSYDEHNKSTRLLHATTIEAYLVPMIRQAGLMCIVAGPVSLV